MSVRPATSTPEHPLARAEVELGLEQATVAVLMGGRSSEREVSLSSGRTVLKALATPSGAHDRRGPARVVGVELLADGRWRLGKRTLLCGEAGAALTDVDLVFSALHGGEGENGALQGLLTCCDLAFTGSGVIASAVAMDKGFARELVRPRGVCVAPAVPLSRDEWSAPTAALRSALEPLLASGCVVKPRRGGSSVGCSIVRHAAEFEPALERAFLEGPELLVEALVEGVETTGAVLEDPSGTLLSLPPVEIRPRSTFFDYREKYAEDGALELCPPTGIDAQACARVEHAALAAHRALGCEGYSRSDFIVPAGGGEPVFLELNTLPGLTPRSLLPRAAAAVGVDYRSLCLWIARSGLARGGARRNG